MTHLRPDVAGPRRGAVVLASAVFLIATLAMFGDVLLGGTRLLSEDGEDLADTFLYKQQFGLRELRQGNLALWNPHVYSGAPYFGGFEPALAYPPSWLGLGLPPVLAINLDIALHFFLGGLWTYLWASRRRLHPAACVLAGWIFMFCGAHFLQLYRGHFPNLRTIVWAPLILLAVDGMIETAACGWVLLGMAAVAMQILAGNIQLTFYTAVVVGIYAALCWGRSPHRLRSAAGIVATYAGGAALTAVQLLAGFAAVSESLRQRLPYEIARTFAFPPENLLTLVLPGVYGDMISMPYWGRWMLPETSLFIGCAPALLVLYAAVHGPRTGRRFSLALALTALVLALGYSTPLFRLLYDYVPGFGSFRGITKFTFLASLFLAMLAAVGFDLLLRVRAPARWPGAVALAGGLLLLAIGGAVLASAVSGAEGRWGQALAALDVRDEAFQYYPVDRSGDFTVRAGTHAAQSMFIAGTTLLILGGLWHAVRRRKRLAYAIVVVACVELFAYARYTRPSFDAGEHLRLSDRVGAFMKTTGGDFRVLSTAPYAAMNAGAYDIWGDDPMVLTRYAEFVAFTLDVSPHDLTVTGVRYPARPHGMLRLRYLLYLEGTRLRAIHTNLDELPRASLLSKWRVVPDRDQRLAAMADPGFDPRATVLLETEPHPTPVGEGGRGTVLLTDLSTDAIEIRAELPEPAILVVSDNYSTGWRATALPDSVQRGYAVMPANHTLRAIPLAAGSHHLLLEYRPTAFVVGRWITALSLVAYVLALLGLCASRWRREFYLDDARALPV